MRNYRPRAVVALTSALLSLTVGASGIGSAVAAAGPAWTINQLVATQSGLADLTAVAASGEANAWASGSDGYMPYIEHWNGQSWTNMTPSAAAFRTKNTRVDAIGTTGAKDTWAFVSSATDGYVMHWNGTGWRKFSFHRYLIVTGLAVFSPSNVWAFAQTGNWTPFVRHYDGHAWRTVAIPAVPFGASAPSSGQIWAVGPVTSTYLQSKPARNVLMRSTGKAWSTVKLPGLGMTNSQQFVPTCILAAARNDVWVTGDIWSFPNGRVLKHKLLHWSGGKWRSYAAPTSLGSIASDGNGGVWVAEIPGMPVPGAFAHFTHGTWQVVPAPLPQSSNPNQVVGVQELAGIPGTHSIWAVAALATYGWDAIVYKYGP